MKRAMLLMSLVVAGHWGVAAASVPVFQLGAHETGAQGMTAIHAGSANIARDSAYKTIRTVFVPGSAPAQSAAPAVFRAMADTHEAWPDARAATLDFSPNAGSGRLSEGVVSSVIIPDDSLFHFLKDFKAQPLQKPELWTLLLVGLCLLLYQVRRRPTRKSISFIPAAKVIG